MKIFYFKFRELRLKFCISDFEVFAFLYLKQHNSSISDIKNSEFSSEASFSRFFCTHVDSLLIQKCANFLLDMFFDNGIKAKHKLKQLREIVIFWYLNDYPDSRMLSALLYPKVKPRKISEKFANPDVCFWKKFCSDFRLFP